MSYTKAFNDHFSEFIGDMISVFPENDDLRTLSVFISTIRKANPKILGSVWYECVTVPYGSKIEGGEIDYFLEKDYSLDLEGNSSRDEVIKSIDSFRQPIREMSPDNKGKALKYIQNLTKLSKLLK